MSELTHAFMDLARVGKNRPDVKAYVKAKVPCLKPEFIAAHLTDHPAPTKNDFIIPELQKKQGDR